MRSTIIQTLAVVSSVVAASRSGTQQEQDEIVSARQAFREIHDWLLSQQLGQLHVGYPEERNLTGWMEDEEVGRVQVKEDEPEDRPRGESGDFQL